MTRGKFYTRLLVIQSMVNALELAVESSQVDMSGVISITLEVAQESIQKRAIHYDKDGDAHYDTISAFIKSVRGSDPDAALYWLAKMIYAGESARFILRRLIILASEDVGMADPNGLLIAIAASQAFEYIGMPEGVYPIVEDRLLGKYFYQPSDQGYEKEVDKRLQRWRTAQKSVLGIDRNQYESPSNKSD